MDANHPSHFPHGTPVFYGPHQVIVNRHGEVMVFLSPQDKRRGVIWARRSVAERSRTAT